MKSEEVGQLKYVTVCLKSGLEWSSNLENVIIRMERFCNMNRGCIFVG